MSTETSSRAPRRPPPALTLPAPRRDIAGFAAALLLHGLLVLALVLGGLSVRRDAARAAGDGADGPAGGGGGGAGNRGRVSYIALPPTAANDWATPAPEVVAEPEPEAETPVEEAPAPVLVPEVAATAPSKGARPDPASTTGAGSGSGAGPGSGGGSGSGSGGAQGTGTGLASGPGTGGDSTEIIPPQLRNWVPPTEKPPKDLRGRTLRVTFWITADGRVARFETDPEIRDRDYLEKFTEIVMKTRFRPARTRSGVPVPVVYPMDFVLQAGS